jgi:hypothetical protein
VSGSRQGAGVAARDDLRDNFLYFFEGLPVAACRQRIAVLAIALQLISTLPPNRKTGLGCRPRDLAVEENRTSVYGSGWRWEGGFKSIRRWGEVVSKPVVMFSAFGHVFMAIAAN